MSLVLVTGGAGFIGSHLVDELLDGGHAVRVFDDFSTGKRENLAPALSRATGDIEVIEGDVRDLEALRGAVAGCQAVVHLAAIASVQASYERLDEVNCVNVGGTVKTLRAAREAGVGRVVFASSCAVYGDATDLPIDEATATRPLSPYAVGKLAGEGYCRSLASTGEIDTVAPRFFNVYGPRQDAASPYSGVIAAFAAAASAGRGCIVHGDGEQTRDFVYVGDLVRALVAAATRAERFDGEVVNLGSGVETSVNEIVAQMRRASGAELAVEAGATRSGDIRRSRAAFDRAETMLHWRPEVTFEQGMSLTWQWYAEQNETPSSAS